MCVSVNQNEGIVSAIQPGLPYPGQSIYSVPMYPPPSKYYSIINNTPKRRSFLGAKVY